MSPPAAQSRPRRSNESIAPKNAEGADPLLPQHRLETRINGRDCSIPIQAGFGEHRSLCSAAALLGGTGGLDAKLLPATWSTVRLTLLAGAETLRVQRRISALAGDLLQIGMDASVDGVPPGCIPGFVLRDRGASRFDADLYIEKADAARQLYLEHLCLEAAARAIALPLARLAECDSDPTIRWLSTHVEHVRVTCRVEIGALTDASARGTPGLDSALPFGAARIHDLTRWFGADSHQPLLTAEHNEHVIGAASAAAIELGLDPLEFELDARAHATRWGSCEPLATWRWREHELLGQLQIPLAVHGGDAPDPLGARRRVPNGQSASDLMLQVAGVGLIASLSFICRGLAPSQHQRHRRLLPPPLLEPTFYRQGKLPSSRKAVSESGVHPAISSASGAPWSHAG